MFLLVFTTIVAIFVAKTVDPELEIPNPVAFWNEARAKVQKVENTNPAIGVRESHGVPVVVTLRSGMAIHAGIHYWVDSGHVLAVRRIPANNLDDGISAAIFGDGENHPGYLVTTRNPGFIVLHDVKFEELNAGETRTVIVAHFGGDHAYVYDILGNKDVTTARLVAVQSKIWAEMAEESQRVQLEPAAPEVSVASTAPWWKLW